MTNLQEAAERVRKSVRTSTLPWRQMDALDAAITEVERPPVPCCWHDDDGNVWITDCGLMFQFENDDPPSGNQMKFCCYCGKPLTEELYQEGR